MWREAAKFGVVGALAFVVDNGGYNLLVFGLPGGAQGGPMDTYPVQASVLFFVANGVGLVITAGTVYASRHLLGLDSPLSDNTARIMGWVLATLFRFYAYRRYVCVAS